MKRVLLGTLSCLAVVVALLALASRWAALFWLLVLAICLYFLFGRKVELELRVGVGGDGVERRVYLALVWKRGAGAPESAEQCELAQLEVGGRCREAWVIAVGDVQLEIVLCLTLRGTVRELAAFMEALTSSGVVVGFGQARCDGNEREGTFRLSVRPSRGFRAAARRRVHFPS